ncbi:trypco2 family protein [Streptomyces niveus]|uniref:trypco2 family protein n=1 Tax=Streptomyces niveus TaxID=193462 RepID=UPI0036837CBF
MPRTNLTDALRSLYDELHEAMSTIPVRDGLNFRYDSVEVELAVEMGESTEGGGGAKFWVVEASGKKAAEQRTTHTMRINLTPVVEPTSRLRLPSACVVASCRSLAADESGCCRVHRIPDQETDLATSFMAEEASEAIASRFPLDQDSNG